MDEKAAMAAKLIRKDIARIVVSVIPMFMLLWTIHTGFKLATEPRREAEYNHLAFLFGAATIVFGLIYGIIGLAIVADLALNLSGWLRPEEKQKTGIHQVRETKTIRKDIARIVVTVISMFMLLLAIYTGFRLATEHRRDSKYDHLSFSVGVVTTVFGLIYYIIGLAIVAELAQNLSGRLRWREEEDTCIRQGSNKDENYFV